MFTKFKQAMQDHLAFCLNTNHQRLYVTDVDKEEMWQTYLASLPEAERQEHNCNCCKSFIRHYGGLVMLKENRIVTIWDFPCEAPFDDVVIMLAALVGGAKIKDVFVTKEGRLGTDSNVAQTKEGKAIRWSHMYFNLPHPMVSHTSDSVEKLMGEARDNRNVFKRSLEEITLDAIDTTLDLIAQNSLYRGVESKSTLETFRQLKVKYDALPADAKDNYTWSESSRVGGTVAKIRNSAIGTLLINISEGKELDDAVRMFESVMAPANYKRPTAIVSKKMIEEAEKTIETLGYAQSLGRRFATVDDLTVNNLLFVNRDVKKTMGLLSDLKDTVPVSAKSFGKVEEVSIENFLTNVLPKCTSVEVLFENRHVNNLMSLIAPQDAKAPTMFKWNNGFSWSYKDAVADSMKEKVKAAGGRVEGELRVSLEWYNFDDLDLWVTEPGGYRIFYSNKVSPTGGNLDVDMNAGSGTTREAVENIIWPQKHTMKEGRYLVQVNQFSRRETIDIGFSVEIECQGKILTFGYDKPLGDQHLIGVAEFNYSKSGGLALVKGIEYGNAKVTSKNVWGIDTNKFHTASMILNSPNFWDSKQVGNQHLFFVLDAAHNDEVARGFFNEFLKPELEVHKRVFEALGSRMKVAPADKQVTGLGFSVTQHSDVVVKVDGAFTRTLKLKF